MKGGMSKTLCWLNCVYIHVTKSHGLESSFSLELSLVFLGGIWMPTFIPHSQGSRIWVVFCGTFLQIRYQVAFAYCGCLQWYPWGRVKLKAFSSEYFLLIYLWAWSIVTCWIVLSLLGLIGGWWHVGVRRRVLGLPSIKGWAICLMF
jgi:hypothetical protein